MFLLAAATAIPAEVLGAGFDHDHRAFDALLRRHVKDGRVDYARLAGDRKALDAYVAGLARAKVTGFSRAEAEAFWINAYNALTLKLIIDRGEKRSIMNIEKAWDKPTFNVGGRTVTLNQIEHEILRPTYDDPRLHAVLVCAAHSCPILESRVFTPGDLDDRLEAAARRFARDTERNRLDGTTLRVSKLFEWYGKDFVGRFAPKSKTIPDAIRGFFSHYLGRPVPTGATITYLEYDWSLNGRW